jgi:toxin FitB
VADVLIDTDVASVLQKGRAPAWINRHLVGARVWLSFVTIGELWKWAEVQTWGQGNRTKLKT